MKEAKARIKINELLKEAGWRFFDEDGLKANILLENNVKITEHLLDDLGEDFEKKHNGFVDFLLLDESGHPLIVLEAKAEDKNPLIGKEQARQYARSQNCRFVILSNGNQHYFWDTLRGNPQVIARFPGPGMVSGYAKFKPNPDALVREQVDKDYIARTQRPDYATDPSWLNDTERGQFIETNKLRFLRPYQLQAAHAVQQAVQAGQNRFLFEMATGTGKTLVSAAIIKLFLRTSNARRVLFLVDRLELEDQAAKAFKEYLRNDYQCVIYKENRDDWRKAEVVVSTVQTMLAGNRYKRLFAPDDFDLVISDEAHRSIGGNARAVFEYFMGYKLGLTATPKDYLKHINAEELNLNDPRALERRMLLDTYKTFGCENGEPTFRYSLIDGVHDGFLINPVVVDARTEITTQLLSDKGYAVVLTDEDGKEIEDHFIERDFEKTFFSEETNSVFCAAFLEHALRDPISDEVGKSIIFCVSQNHAAKIAQTLNEMAMRRWPGKYQSDFALQVTSLVKGAQQFTINFTNNNLSGKANFISSYRTSKTRVCVTVGMMTTGYDCQDILNLALMRPIFSPTDFIQIKGRGTRIYNFSKEINDLAFKKRLGAQPKERFKIFDFFANCEYFEEEYNYDEVLDLPRAAAGARAGTGDEEQQQRLQGYEETVPDRIAQFTVQEIGPNGMKIDRMYFQGFEAQVRADEKAAGLAASGQWEQLEQYVESEHLNKPQGFYTLETLRKALKADRRISLREIMEYVMGLTPYIKSRAEVLEDEFDRFDSRVVPDEKDFSNARRVFIAYILDHEFRQLVDTGEYGRLHLNPHGEAFFNLSKRLQRLIPEYVKDHVPLNQFAG